jgi:hypothetical protein
LLTGGKYVLNKKTLIAHIAILTILMTALTMAVPAADKIKGKVSVTVAESFFAAGNEVKSGDYQVKWESSGTDATATFVAREKTAATLQGKIVKLEKNSAYDTLLTNKDSSGRTVVKELLLGGKSFKIVF